MHHKKRFLLRPLPPPVHFLTTQKESGTKGGKKSGLDLRTSISHERRRNLFICQNRLAPSFLSSGARNCEWGKATTISYLPAKSFSALDRQGKEGGRGIMQAPAEALPCPVGPSTNVNSGDCKKSLLEGPSSSSFFCLLRGASSLPPSMPQYVFCVHFPPSSFFRSFGSRLDNVFGTERFPYFTLAKKHDSFCCALFSHLKTFVKFLIPSRAFRSPSSSLATAGGPSSFLPAALKRGRDDSERTRDEKRGENVPPFFSQGHSSLTHWPWRKEDQPTDRRELGLTLAEGGGGRPLFPPFPSVAFWRTFFSGGSPSLLPPLFFPISALPTNPFFLHERR